MPCRQPPAGHTEEKEAETGHETTPQVRRLDCILPNLQGLSYGRGSSNWITKIDTIPTNKGLIVLLVRT